MVAVAEIEALGITALKVVNPRTLERYEAQKYEKYALELMHMSENRISRSFLMIKTMNN